jgi:CheY-like chemotaxis protein
MLDMPTVLVVEDDPDMRHLQQTMLECSGFEVHVASNGLDALKTLYQLRPCVIVLDLMMPVMDGLKFLSERQQRPAVADVPVVCVSAAGPEMMSEALRLGAQQCVEKPADLDLLCEIVRRHCDAD